MKLMSKMNYDVKTITKWEAPHNNGAALLCMPNVPQPLHLVNPRNIMGEYQWGKVRKQIREEHNYTCQVSGELLGTDRGAVHIHEVYSIDWKKHTSTFERAICLDPLLHTTIIHSGRALTLFKKNDPLMPMDKMLNGLEKGFKLISDWNREHYGEEKLRVCSVILDWAKEPRLEHRVNELIKKYKIKFYDFDESSINKHNWDKWRLLYNGKEYSPKFANQQEWEEYFSKPTVEKPVEKAPEELSILDSILKEEK